MDPHFRFTYPDEVQLWLPLDWAQVSREAEAWLKYEVVARLKRSTSLESAQAAMRDVGLQAARELRSPGVRPAVVVSPLVDHVVGNNDWFLLLLGAAAACIFLLTCVNVASLTVARLSSRLPELGVRRALGADDRRILRDLVGESAVFSMIGGAAAIALAAALVPLLRGMIPATVARADEVALVAPALGLGVLLAAITVIAGGLAPALYIRRFPVGVLLRLSTTTATTPRPLLRIRRLSLTAEIAAVTLLSIAAALCIHSLWNATRIPLGFDSHNSVAFTFRLLARDYPDPYQWMEVQERLVTAAGREPLAREVTATSVLPLAGAPTYWMLNSLGGGPEGGELRSVAVRQVDWTYLRFMHVRVVAGRGFTERDLEGVPPPVVVSRSLARTFYGGAENALGQRLKLSFGTRSAVVGVVDDIRDGQIDRPGEPTLYVLSRRHPSSLFSIVMRSTQALSSGAVRHFEHALRREVPGQAFETQRMDALLRRALATQRFYANALMLLAVVALAVAGSAVYGVVHHVADASAREIAIRRALGATWLGSTRRILQQTAVDLALGLLVGAAGAYWLTRALQGVLYEVSDHDAIAYSAAAVSLSVVAALAAWSALTRAGRRPVAAQLRAE